jgi:hypothetical protein
MNFEQTMVAELPVVNTPFKYDITPEYSDVLNKHDFIGLKNKHFLDVCHHTTLIRGNDILFFRIPVAFNSLSYQNVISNIILKIFC